MPGSPGANTRPGFSQVIQGRWYAANPALYCGLATAARMGNYCLINNDTEAIVQLGYNSAAVRVPV